MEHVAILKKKWGLISKILSGEKKIESRWYVSRYLPWDRIKKGERIYFKNSGEPVSVRAKVDRVVQFSNLTLEEVRKILREYGGKIGISVNERDKFYELFKNKKYCILVFLKNPEKIKPFEISKKGFGVMSAWLSVKNINQLKL